MYGNFETMMTIITVCTAIQVIIAIFNILMLYIIKEDTEDIKKSIGKKGNQGTMKDE